MRLQKSPEARPCQKPGCTQPIRSGRGPRKYCVEHATPNLERYRGRSQREGRTQPRTPAQIRADLAGQLTAQVRRFDSMVAHDRATDPLR